MSRKLALAGALTAAAVLVAAAPAGAITFGQLDNGAHPNVGAIAADISGDGRIRAFCTGTLISETVVVTAGHCTDFYRELGLGAHDAYVSFDDNALSSNASRTLHRGTWHTHPLYGVGGTSDSHEIGVVVLDQPYTGAVPATLPSSRELSLGSLKGTRYVAVGYGQVREDKTAGPNNLLPSGVRHFAEQTFSTLSTAWLTLSQNPSLDNGGTCYGDSGGPHFAKSTGKIVSLTITGDTACRSRDKTYRLDSRSARDFLDDYVTLP
jgi:secreted trypsin-like serine protease